MRGPDPQRSIEYKYDYSDLLARQLSPTLHLNNRRGSLDSGLASLSVRGEYYRPAICLTRAHRGRRGLLYVKCNYQYSVQTNCYNYELYGSSANYCHHPHPPPRLALNWI